MNNTNDPFPLPFHAKAFRALLPMFAVLSLFLASAHGATPIPAGSRVLFLGNGADALMTEMTNITAGDPVASAANLTFDSYDLNDNPPFTRNLVSALFLDRTYPKFFGDYLAAPDDPQYHNAYTQKLDENFDYVVVLLDEKTTKTYPEVTMFGLMALDQYIKSNSLNTKIIFPMAWDADNRLEWSYAPWTNDDDSGISSEYTYDIAHNFTDSTSDVVINGVTFTQGFGSGSNWSMGGATLTSLGDTNNIQGDSSQLAEDFIYGGFPRSITFENLTPGVMYKATFYSVGAEGGSTDNFRIIDFDALDGTTMTVNQNTYGNNEGIAISLIYEATSTSKTIEMDDLRLGGQSEDRSFHLYAMTHREYTALNPNTAAFQEHTYRIGDALGLEVVPAGLAWHALLSDGSVTESPSILQYHIGSEDTFYVPSNEARYTMATSLYSHFYAQKPSGSDYTPDGMSASLKTAIQDASQDAYTDAKTATHYTGDYTSRYFSFWETPMDKSRRVMAGGTSTERRSAGVLDLLFTAAGYPDSGIWWNSRGGVYSGLFPSNSLNPNVQADVASEDFAFTVGRNQGAAYAEAMNILLPLDPGSDFIHYVFTDQGYFDAGLSMYGYHSRIAWQQTQSQFDQIRNQPAQFNLSHPNFQATPNYLGYAWLAAFRPEIFPWQDTRHLNIVGTSFNSVMPYVMATGENPLHLPDVPLLEFGHNYKLSQDFGYEERYTYNLCYEMIYMLSGLRALDNPIVPKVLDQSETFTNNGQDLRFRLHAIGPSNHPLQFNLITAPEAGSLSFNDANNIITYTPQAGRADDVTFTYTVTADGRTSEEATVTLSTTTTALAASLTDGESARYTFLPVAEVVSLSEDALWNGLYWEEGSEIPIDRNSRFIFETDLFHHESYRAALFDIDLRETGILYFAGEDTQSYALADGSDTVFSPANGWANVLESHPSSPFIMGDSDWVSDGSATANPINGFVPDDGSGIEEVNWLLLKSKSFHLLKQWIYAGNSDAVAIGIIWKDDGDGLLEDSGDDRLFIKYALSAHHERGQGVAFAMLDSVDKLNAAVGNVPQPEILLIGNGVEVSYNSTEASTTNDTFFGGAMVVGETVPKSLRVLNTGGAVLSVSDVTISGEHAGDFILTSARSFDVSEKSEANLHITFNPSSAGDRNATVTIHSNDSDEGTYSFAIQGVGTTEAAPSYIKKIEYIDHNNDGVTSTPLWDGTDWGPGYQLELGGAYSSTFRSEDSGGGTRYMITRWVLNGDGILRSSSSSHYEPGIQDTVRFSPSIWQNVTTDNGNFFTMGDRNWNKDGIQTANPIHGFTADDGVGAEEINWIMCLPDSGSAGAGNADAIAVGIIWYDDDGDGLLLNAGDDRIVIKYALSADHPSGQTAAFAEMDTLGELNAAVGNVVSSPEPEILVSGNSLELTSGDNEPSAADHTDFGSVDTFDGSVNRTFTIRNFGTADLNISSVDIAGAHAGDFSVTASPATTVPAGNETSFTVTFDPSIGGPRSATISIVNNDHEENPFTFAIQGLGTYPPSYNPPTIDQGNQGNSVSVTMSEDGSPTAFALDLTATNIDNAPLSWSLTSGASHGTATASGTGSVPVITYTPEANFNGSDSFTVTVSDDDRGGYDTVTVEVTVEPVNDAPVATSGSVALFADETANIVLSSSDVDGDALTVTIVSGPSHGSLSGTGPSFTYSPDPDFAGTDTLTFKVNDGSLDSNEATFTFDVSAVTYIKKIEYIDHNNDGVTRTQLWDGTNWGPGFELVPGAPFSSGLYSEGSGGTRYMIMRLVLNAEGILRSTSNSHYEPGVEETVRFSPSLWQNVSTENKNYFTMGDGDWQTDGTATANPVNGFTADDGTGAEEINWIMCLPDSGSAGAGNANAIAIGIIWYDDGDGLLEDSGDDRIVIKYALSADHPSGQAAAFAEMDTLDELNAAVGNVVASPEPEIAVTGNSLGLTSGDNEPGAADHTDFGSTDVAGGTVERTFTIQNSGTADLSISSVDLSGTDAGDFSVTTSPAETVTSGGETTFTVTFDPSADGLRTATVSIANNDIDENPFTFAIQGTGTTSFVDSDADGIDDNWEELHFPGNLTTVDATSDFDRDGTSDYVEFKAGTDPTDPSSRFTTDIMEMRPQTNEMDISWPAADGRSYSIWYSENLVDWFLLQSGIEATPPDNSHTIETNPEDTKMFFRVEVE